MTLRGLDINSIFASADLVSTTRRTLEGARFEELREGHKVSFNEGRGPKGPRAENVRLIQSDKQLVEKPARCRLRTFRATVSAWAPSRVPPADSR